ncbi:NAD(P)/FAD-dependent oxidoreductase [Kushneria aurantia]|uniref:NAD(P)/FAD-dependent oxidoreductase n=1 Tax=Kushneria aurantia TaxID=504092 RepID=A0ABV6FZR9_9GAMM|nr:NAD(P)/FAD-dependent oxidoreductase [Kushneria aurantia]
MRSYDYLIVGGGMVAANAVKGIRERDEQGTIGILTEEPNGPVTRPALSKLLWTDPDFTYDKIWMTPEEDDGTTLHTDSRVTAIDRDKGQVTTQDGQHWGYGKLLLATGCAPIRLELPESERVRYYRNVSDFDAIKKIAGEGRHIVVVGGSYIGTEMAAALVQNDCRVTLVHTEEVLGSAMFEPALASRFHQRFVDNGVMLLGGRKVTGGREENGSVTVELDDGSTIEADAAVLGLGVEPAVDFVAEAGIEVDDGIVVNERLTTSDANIFAAGDVARYPDPLLGSNRAEHVDNANRMGAAVGRIMAGSDEQYAHTPFFYSMIFDMKWRAVGTLDSTMAVIEDAPNGPERAIYYYLEGERVKGVLLYNVEAEKLDDARAVLADDAPQSAETLIGRIEVV